MPTLPTFLSDVELDDTDNRLLMSSGYDTRNPPVRFVAEVPNPHVSRRIR